MWRSPTCRYLPPISKLPDELNLIIWEYTWPGPGMTESVTYNDEEAEEYINATNYRIAGPLSALLEQDFGMRISEERPEYSPHVALQVSHDYWKYKLSQYHIVESMASLFYVNPYRDILRFSIDLTDEPKCLQYLMRYHERESSPYSQQPL